MTELTGPAFQPTSGVTKALVVLLHGLGADGNDLIGLAPVLAPHLPDTAFIAPDAPQACDMAPFGRQWFSLQDRDPGVMLAGAQGAAPVLDAFLDRELERTGLTADRLVLVGFSQGTMMSLFVGPRRAEKIAGIVGFSGALLAPDLLASEKRSAPDVALIHGDADEIVPVAALPAAVDGLQAAGISVRSAIRPGLGHSIDNEGLGLALGFIHEVLGMEGQTQE